MLPELTDTKIIEMIVAESSAGSTKCPPHNFAAAWATKSDESEDTVSVMFCTLCGDVRKLRSPE